MKTKLLLACAWLMLLAIALPVFSTSTPTADDGKWYYVKSQRYGTGGPWWTLNTTTNVASPGALTKADVQKFTLVSTPVSGKVTIKEFSGKLMSAAASGAFDATGAATGWTIVANTVSGVAGTAFSGENSGIHQFNAGNGWKVASGWYSLTDNCTFFFYEATPDVDLNLAIDDATTKLNSAVVGTRAGQTPQSAYDAFLAAINTAKTTMGSTDATALQNAIADLNTATTTFVSSKLPVVQSSTSESPVWYLVKNTVRGGKGATLFTNGFNAQMKCTTAANTVAADGTSTGAAAPALANLFRFEIQAGGSYRMINATVNSGEVLQASTGGNSSGAIKFGTATTPATTWNLNPLGYNATLNVDEINIVSAGNATTFHDDGSNNVVSWTGGTGGASAWYVEAYTGTVSDLYQAHFDALTAEYNVVADAQGNSLAPYLVGTEPGQYDAVKFQAVKEAYSFMLTEKNLNGVTSAGMPQKFADFSVALGAFKSTTNLPKISTENSVVWYYIKAQRGVAAPFYLTAKSNNGTITAEADASSDYQIWKIVANGTGYAFQNKADNSYLNYDATPFGTKAEMPVKFFNFSTSSYLAGAFHISGSGYTMHAGGGTGGMMNYGVLSDNASFVFVQYTPVYTALGKTSNQISVKAIDRKIVVTGTDAEISAYTITGARVDATKTLSQGIYIVKVANQTFKVNVQ